MLTSVADSCENVCTENKKLATCLLALVPTPVQFGGIDLRSIFLNRDLVRDVSVDGMHEHMAPMMMSIVPLLA